MRVATGPSLVHRACRHLRSCGAVASSAASVETRRARELLTDETTRELDSITEMEIVLPFHRIVTEKAVTAVVASHDPALSQIADQTMVMRAGRLAEAEGPLDFDLPDLVQHVEIVDPATARPVSDR